MIQLETGDTGRAVTAESDGTLYSSIFGSDKYVLNVGNKFKAEIQNNNKIKINDGSAIFNGRHVRIPSNDSELVTIENGSQGMNRIDLIVIRYKKESSGKEDVSLKVIKGVENSNTPIKPSHLEGNILTGSLEADMVLYEVQIDGINITAVNAVFKNALDLQKTNESISKSGEMVLLGSTNNTSYQEFKIDLSPYKSFVLLTTIIGKGILSSIVIPKDFINRCVSSNETMVVIYAEEQKTYKGRMYFKQGGTGFFLKNDGTVNQNYNTVMVYGVL